LFVLNKYNNQRICPAGVIALATALTGNSTMTTLDLSCVLKYVALVL
jgi:hypothetical protein